MPRHGRWNSLRLVTFGLACAVVAGAAWLVELRAGELEASARDGVGVQQGSAVSPAAARIWILLGKPLSMPFTDETPLGDVLRYIQSATQSPDLAQGIQFYVDPNSLLEAGHTLESSVTLNLEGIPLATTLDLMLQQLDLGYTVRPEGYVLVTYRGSDELPANPAALASEFRALRAELEELRQQIAQLRATIAAGEKAGPVLTDSSTGFSTGKMGREFK